MENGKIAWNYANWFMINIILLIHTATFWYIIIQWTSYDLAEKFISLVSLAKLVKWQNCKSALCDFTEKLLVSDFIWQPNLQIILKAKSMDESPWKKKIYYISFYSRFCRSSYFHCEWPQLATILTSLDLSKLKKLE